MPRLPKGLKRTPKVNMNIRLPVVLKKQIMQAANKRTNGNMSYLVQTILDAELNKPSRLEAEPLASRLGGPVSR